MHVNGFCQNTETQQNLVVMLTYGQMVQNIKFLHFLKHIFPVQLLLPEQQIERKLGSASVSTFNHLNRKAKHLSEIMQLYLLMKHPVEQNGALLFLYGQNFISLYSFC